MIPKCIFEKHGYFDENLRFVLDWNLWLKFALVGVDFYFDREELVSNRVHSMQVTVKQRDLHLKETDVSVDQIKEIMKETNAAVPFWKMLYEFSYASSRGDSLAIKAELRARKVKVSFVKLLGTKLKNKCIRLAKRIYHKLR